MTRATVALLMMAASGYSSAASSTSAPADRQAISFKLVRSAIQCRRLLSDYSALCTRKFFENGQMEIAHVDIDGDRHQDLVIRRQSSLECGSHGCSTEVYFRRHGRYSSGTPPLITAGPIYRCRSGKAFGLQTTTSDGRGPCIGVK